MTDKLTTQNFSRICGLNGFSVSGLCERIGRQKSTVYRALKKPHYFKPTYKLLVDNLVIRKGPHDK